MPPVRSGRNVVCPGGYYTADAPPGKLKFRQWPASADFTRSTGNGTVRSATWLAARSLNMPEPVVHDTGVFVFVQVQTIENRVGKALCPTWLVRQLRSLLQR